MNREHINEGILKGGELLWSGNCGFLKRPDGEYIPWVSDDLFKREGFKKELAETFQFQLAAAETFGGEKFSDAIWMGTTILLEAGAYIPTPNTWVPNIGGYFLVRDPAISDETLIASHGAKGKKSWWKVWK